MRKALTVTAALVAGAVLLTGCGGSGDDEAAKGGSAASSSRAEESPRAEESSQPAPAEKGIDGTWRTVNDSPLDTLEITGTEVATTGELACAGTLEGVNTDTPRITLDCAEPDPERTRGTLKIKSDGTAVSVAWDGPEWGGVIDTLRRD
ncbi:hypothetical protein [Streptomyces sp. NPDC002644]